MLNATRTSRAACFLFFCLIAATSVVPFASAQADVAPTAKTYFSVTPVPFAQAQQSTLQHPLAVHAQNVSGLAVVAPPEIVELARALQNDPDLIYQYVHDNIEFSPLFGSLKGPVGTLLDGRGDSFDQSALMVALLSEASLTNSAISNVTFEFGQLTLTNAQLQSWLGVDSNPYSVSGVLAQGGIPATVFSDGSATVGHVWVKVSINGAPYVFDPAFKAHTWSPGIVSNLAGIMGYTQATFVANANATVTATSIQGVNRTQLRNDLTAYANNLAAYIRSNAPMAGIKDIVGGGTITPTPFVNGQTIRLSSNPNESATPTDWASIPSSYLANITITIPGATAQTYNSQDIYGHRLSVFFDASYVPTLYLDGTPVVSGSASSQGAQVGINLSISIPWATFADQSRTQYVAAQTNQNGGSGGYLIQTGWDQVGRGMIEKHRALLNQLIKSGAAADSEPVLGESLAVLGYTWLAEAATQQRLSDQLLGTATQYFYGVGIVGEAVGTTISSPYVDLPLNFIDTPARVNGASAQTANSLAAFLDASGTSSSFESAMLEQTQEQIPGFAAASTVKLLDTALQNADTIFDINNGNTTATQQNYTGVIEPQLAANYNANDLATITNYVSQGFRVIAPLHGKTAVGAWTGVGFKTLLSSGSSYSYGEIISGGLSGGFGGVNNPPAVLVPNTALSGAPPANLCAIPFFCPAGPSVSGNGMTTVGDPIDHQKGSYLYKHDDLTIGAGTFPYGLTFERYYDSGAAEQAPGPLGYGWTHNFDITATIDSDGFSGMGQASPLNAVNSIVALYVSSDLMKGQAIDGQPNLEYFTLETIVNRWFTDQLTQNTVIVRQGSNAEQFTKDADGSYAPPVGSAALLDATTGTFRYRSKNGVTMTFDTAGNIASWTNAAGATVTFSFVGGMLSNVANSATGRQLQFTFTGNQLSSVSDGKRTVEYGYTNGNLTSFTDALGQATTFAYDTSGTEDTAGHLTEVFYPSNPSNPFVTIFYDSLGRSNQQRDANGNITQTLIAGSRTEIDDPVGNRHVLYNDGRGNVTLDVADYGPAPHLNVTTLNAYDGQSNLLTTTLPEGNSISIAYDSLFNPVSITQTPKPTSSLSPLVQKLTYTIPVALLTNFEEVQTTTDRNGGVTTYTYNTGTGTLSKIDHPAVNKPGVGLSVPEEVFTYTSIGLPQTVQDAEGRVTRFDYDASLGDQVIKSTVDYGRLNLITQFVYDSYGDISSVVDANGHTTVRQFDALRHLTELDGAIAGVVTKYAYYPDGLVNTIARQLTPGTFESTTYVYSLSDKVEGVTDPMGNTVATTYDADDRIATVTAPVTATTARQRTFTYDALGHVTQISDTTAASSPVPLEQYTYSPNGNELGLTDANGNTTGYAYDGFDRLSQTKYPDGGAENNQYDANGNVLLKTVRSGQNIGFTYDALNRVATKTPVAESAGQVTYGYDLTSRLLQASDASAATAYQIAYDTAGRPNSFTDQQGRNVQQQYDAVGNRIRLQWPANTSGVNAFYATYNFDALNRMTEIDANGSTATPLVKYQWDSLSRLASISYGDGTRDSYSLYDAADNPLALVESFSGGSGVTFNYTWFNNHQRASCSVDNSIFQFVPFTGSTSYTSDADDGYVTVGAATITYDGNHNVAYDGSNTMAYDVENRLIQAVNVAAGTNQYLYDPLGNRKQKTVNGVTTQFLVAGGDEIADYSGTGTGIPQVLTVRGIDGAVVAAITPSSGAAVYYHGDVLGSTVAVTQAGTSGAGDVYTYDEFGDPGAGTYATYRFAGYRYDNETHLYYDRARYLSPALGRFLQPDPIGIAGGPNLYAYVGNDPVNLVDPLGTCADPQGCSVINSIVTTVSNLIRSYLVPAAQATATTQANTYTADNVPPLEQQASIFTDQLDKLAAATKRWVNTIRAFFADYTSGASSRQQMQSGCPGNPAGDPANGCQ